MCRRCRLVLILIMMLIIKIILIILIITKHAKLMYSTGGERPQKHDQPTDRPTANVTLPTVERATYYTYNITTQCDNDSAPGHTKRGFMFAKHARHVCAAQRENNTNTHSSTLCLAHFATESEEHLNIYIYIYRRPWQHKLLIYLNAWALGLCSGCSGSYRRRIY